jgi:hypothetical protein
MEEIELELEWRESLSRSATIIHRDVSHNQTQQHALVPHFRMMCSRRDEMNQREEDDDV